MKKWSQVSLVVLLIVATIFRIFLTVKGPYYIAADAGFDDQLFLNYSTHLIQGDWLGPYTNTTLAKGISYSVFISLAHNLQLPYPWLLALLNLTASLAVSWAFYGITKKRWFQSIIYLFFLYSPITLTAEYATRIYRNALVVPAVVFLIACTIGVYTERQSLKRQLPWLVLAMVMLPFYWYLREDSIWLLPFLVAGFSVTGVKMLLDSPRRWQGVLLLSLPFLSLWLTTQLIIQQNKAHYGVALVNDRTQGSFGHLMKQLIRIDAKDNGDAKVWVSKAQLKKAEAVSPTLRKLDLNWIYQDSPWSHGEDIAGDIIFWALRDAATRDGLYHNAKQTEHFWQRVVKELDQGYQTGRLKEKNEFYVTSTGDGKTVADLPVVADFMGAGLNYNLFYSEFAQGQEKSTGPLPLILHDEKILRTNLRPANENPAAKWANRILEVERLTARLIGLLGLAGVFLMSWRYWKQKNYQSLGDYLLIFSGLILTYLLFLFGISWFCSWDPNRMAVFMLTYSGAGVTVVQFIISWGLLGWLTVRRRQVDDNQTIKTNR